MTDAVDQFSDMGREAELAASGDDEPWFETQDIDSMEFLTAIAKLHKGAR